MSRENEIRKLIAAHHRRLQILKEQQASFGSLHTPAYILTEIEDTEAAIEELETELKALEDRSVDEESPGIQTPNQPVQRATSPHPPPSSDFPGKAQSAKYALIIGNNQHDDPAWPDLKTPEQDAEAMAEVLNNPKIGGFNDVETLVNASVQEMRIAIAELFDPRQRQPDDILLLYFSGHGELDDNDNLYFVGRETRPGSLARATGLEARYITDSMDDSRSRRQIIILDSCYSGAFGKGGTESAVPTKEIFKGNGEGRYILASSEALQRSWESDESVGRLESSFFTHFLVEGLRTGAADRDNDGLIHIDELYDHIYEGMAKGTRNQTPVKHAVNVEGKLVIARSPISPFERAREQLTDLLVQAENAVDQGDYDRAEKLLAQVIKAEPESLLGLSAQQMLADIMAERKRAVAYNDVKRLLAKRSKRAARRVWQTFVKQYPDYDPDDLAGRLATPTRRKSTASPPVSTPRKSEASPQPRQKPTAPKKPQVLQAEDILPAPFAWIEIPGKGYSIAKYPLTNAQFALFVKAGGYKEKKWWTEAGWQVREKKKWTKPRLWTDSQWNGARQPVVGVSWYEAVAYCLWLSEKTGQKIMPPTEEQWQYAAQGDDGREYPWGSEWDCKRCNNSVKPCDSNTTTPVTAYEGKGDSPFGVVDMAGNVWEWCLTEYESGSNDLNGTNVRVLRGGSWFSSNSDLFRVSARFRYYPHFRYDYWGFRLALSL